MNLCFYAAPKTIGEKIGLTLLKEIDRFVTGSFNCGFAVYYVLMIGGQKVWA